MRRYAFLAVTAAALSALAVPAIEAAQATGSLRGAADGRSLPTAVGATPSAEADFAGGRPVRIVYGAPVAVPLRSPR